MRRSEPRLLRLSRLDRQRRLGRQVLHRALPELQRLQGLRLDGRAERRALRLPRDPRGRDRPDRQRLVGQHAGNEADDKCAWSPTPFIGTGGYGYQYEWSNLTTSCIRTR